MATVGSAAAWTDRLKFINRFVHSPRTVGSVVPSSKWLAAAMVAPIECPVWAQRAKGVVELGAGTGAFTEAIIHLLTPADRFMGVEVEPDFVTTLRSRWTNVDFACASAESLETLINDRRFGVVDHIVSGLPFATLPRDTTRRIVDAVASALRPGGTFTTFHYLHSYAIPSSIAFRRGMTNRLASAPSTQFVLRNFPPALAVTWTTPSAERRR